MVALAGGVGNGLQLNIIPGCTGYGTLLVGLPTVVVGRAFGVPAPPTKALYFYEELLASFTNDGIPGVAVIQKSSDWIVIR